MTLDDLADTTADDPVLSPFLRIDWRYRTLLTWTAWAARECIERRA